MIKFGYNKNCKDKELLGKVAGYSFHDTGNGERIELAGNGPFLCSEAGFAELKRVFPDCYVQLSDDAEIKSNVQENLNSNQIPDGGDQATLTIGISKPAKKLADEWGIDITSIKGSGSGGNILKGDVQAAIDGTDESGVTDPIPQFQE